MLPVSAKSARYSSSTLRKEKTEPNHLIAGTGDCRHPPIYTRFESIDVKSRQAERQAVSLPAPVAGCCLHGVSGSRRKAASSQPDVVYPRYHPPTPLQGPSITEQRGSRAQLPGIWLRCEVASQVSTPVYSLPVSDKTQQQQERA